jgi:hypothetical protein
MNDLIFLPIEIEIISTTFSVNRPTKLTFQGLWETKELNEWELNKSEIKYIADQLPFKKITLVKYNTQSSIIPPHVDVQQEWTTAVEEFNHIKKNEPAGYRVVLIGQNDSLEVFDNREWRQARLPRVPFAYVINSTRCMHKVSIESGRQTLYFRGFLDENKHKELIKTNLNNYGDYAIFSQ